MQPVIGSGFGHFSRLLGPWSDFFPSSGGFGLPTSQFGVAIGTTIIGGPRGASISSLTVEPPFNIAGSTGLMLWRVLVVKGDIPADLTRLGNAWQHAMNGYPNVGDEYQSAVVLWSKVFAANNTPNAGSASSLAAPTEFIFPNGTGPSVSSGEKMTVFIVPLFNETGVPGFGANNFTFLALTVTGRYDRTLGSGSDADVVARSIPRGRVGGM